MKQRTWNNIIWLVVIIICVSVMGFYARHHILIKTVYADPPPKAVLTQQDEIRAYIQEVFGKDADKALLILTGDKCHENKGLRWDAQNYNSDQSVDLGLFQINSVHGVPARFLYNWKINVLVAKQIYDEHGGNFSAWTCARYYGL